MPWPRSFVISAGFEGKGQNFHFIPTSRHDDMKRASHMILLEAMANKLWQGTLQDLLARAGTTFLHDIIMTLSSRKHQRKIDLSQICWYGYRNISMIELFCNCWIKRYLKLKKFWIMTSLVSMVLGVRKVRVTCGILDRLWILMRTLVSSNAQLRLVKLCGCMI